MHSFLSNHKFVVKIDDVMSSSGNACIVVPQASVIERLPFLIYQNDLPDLLNDNAPIFPDDENFWEHYQFYIPHIKII